MKMLYKLFLLLVIALTAVLLPQVSNAQTARLGDMDLDVYCRTIGQGGVYLSGDTWRCQSGVGVHLLAACVWQYGLAVPMQEVPGDPYSWSCYSRDLQLTPTSFITPPLQVTPTPTPGITVMPSPTNQPTPTLAPTPTLTPTPAVTTPTPSPTPTQQLRTRRNIYSLSADELRRLVNAINTLRANGEYQDFVNRHLQTMMVETPVGDPTTDRNVAHRGPAFLPWHRAFIYEFEERLRAVDPSVTLPYWPFEQEGAGIPRVFSAAYLGSDGNRAQNDRVTDGPFASWNIIRRLGRDTETGQTRLPSTIDVNALLQNTLYASPQYNEQSLGFVTEMEGWIGTNAPWGMHNRVHGYIGGDMVTMDSVNDPVFFLMHANVDRLWWQWQQQRSIVTFQPITGGPAGHNLNDQLRFLLRTPTNADVLDIQNDMGYTYN